MIGEERDIGGVLSHPYYVENSNLLSSSCRYDLSSSFSNIEELPRLPKHGSALLGAWKKRWDFATRPWREPETFFHRKNRTTKETMRVKMKALLVPYLVLANLLLTGWFCQASFINFQWIILLKRQSKRAVSEKGLAKRARKESLERRLRIFSLESRLE